MKILLKHISNTFNYGSMMMAENTIQYFKNKLNNDIEFYIDAKEDRDLNRLKESTKHEKIFFDEQSTYKVSNNKIIRKIEKIFKDSTNNKKISDYYDYIIFLGGDDFSEFYMTGFKGKIYSCLSILKLKSLNKNKNIILLGQTVGPYTGIRKFLAKKVFKNLKVITRDDINLKVMKNEYGIIAIPSRDLAFLDLTLQKEYELKYEDILKKYKLENNKYITIIGTELIKHYSSNQDEFINGFVDMIKALKEKYQDKEIVWLSHVTSYPPNLSDNYLLDLINKNCDDFINKNMIVIKERILPVEARIILGHGYLTVTCRMHAAVSTFQTGKPAICLSYSPKYRGVIADGLNMHNLVIESKNDELWKNNIANFVLEKTNYVDGNYELLQNEIKENVEKCKVIVNDTLENLSKELVIK